MAYCKKYEKMQKKYNRYRMLGMGDRLGKYYNTFSKGLTEEKIGISSFKSIKLNTKKTTNTITIEIKIIFSTVKKYIKNLSLMIKFNIKLVSLFN